MRCKKCGVKSHTNYTHGANSKSITTLFHEPYCENKDYNGAEARKSKRRR